MRQNGWRLNGTFHGRFQHDILMLKSSIKKENFLSVDISWKKGIFGKIFSCHMKMFIYASTKKISVLWVK